LQNRPPKLTGLLMLLLMGGWALMPYFILFFINRLSWKSVDGLQLGSVFNVFSMRDDAGLVKHLYFALAWLALMVLVNAKWFFEQIKNFRPPPANASAVIE
jgi:hypothetical protein